MENRILLSGIAALIAVVVLSIAACKHETDMPGPVKPEAFNSIVEFKTWLASASPNTISKPCEVRLNVPNLGGSGEPTVKEVLTANPNKYVNLIVSGSTFTSIWKRSV